MLPFPTTKFSQRSGVTPPLDVANSRIKAAVPGFSSQENSSSSVPMDVLVERLNTIGRQLNDLQTAVFHIGVHLDRLSRYVQVDGSGNVQIRSDGLLLLEAVQKIALKASHVAVAGGTTTLAMNDASLQAAGGGAFKVAMPVTQIQSGTCNLQSGVIRCDGTVKARVFMAAESMISPAYTPGSGNIW